MSFLSRITSSIRPRATRVPIVRQMIGRVAVTTVSIWRRFSGAAYSVDQSRMDYAFYDGLRHGKKQGYRISGLFVTPIAQRLASFVLGSGITIQLAEKATTDDPNDPINYTNRALAGFIGQALQDLIGLLEDMYALGDQYAVMNSDGSLSIPTPDAVEIEYDPLDYRRVVRVTLISRLPSATIFDAYDAAVRTVTVRPTNGDATQTYVYDNLIGKIPIVHFPHRRGRNETHGHSIAESILPLLAEYEDVMNKALDGVKLMGNPIPVFEGLEDIDETIAANAPQETETYMDEDGNEETRKVIHFDRNAGLVLGKGGSFHFAAPNAGFTDDARNMLKALFLVLIDHTLMPEVVWGGAIDGSRASADTQMPPFHRYIELLRLWFSGNAADVTLGVGAKGGLQEMVEIWLKTRALVDPRIRVAPTTITFPELDAESAEMIYKWVELLERRGYLTGETAVRLSGTVEDPATEVERAQAEIAARDATLAAALDATMSAQIQRLASDNPEGDPGDTTSDASAGRTR